MVKLNVVKKATKERKAQKRLSINRRIYSSIKNENVEEHKIFIKERMKEQNKRSIIKKIINKIERILKRN